jgi:hypothetical protein
MRLSCSVHHKLQATVVNVNSYSYMCTSPFEHTYAGVSHKNACPFIVNLKAYFPETYLLLEIEIPVRSHAPRYGDIVVTFRVGYHFGYNSTLSINLASKYADLLEWPRYGFRLQFCNGGKPCNKKRNEK